MNYQCNLDIFEGPLDLLLHLIKEQKMDVYDIPIAEITRQYLTYLDLLGELNLEMVGEYLVMAAELAKIKSKTLLPTPETEEDALSAAGEDLDFLVLPAIFGLATENRSILLLLKPLKDAVLQ